MGKMEQAVKYEIVRLTRKELRATVVPLARDVRRLKRTVSGLTKTVAVLSRLGAGLEAQRTAERAKMVAAPEEVEAARISPGLVKKLRKRLGISQGELATLISVSAGAVGFWEQGKARPGDRNKAALVALRKLGRREVADVLATKAAESAREAKGKTKRKVRGRKKRR